MALELARAGRQAVVLEAGEEYAGNDYPCDELTGSTRLYWNGGYEPLSGARIGMLRGKAVGGSTVVNSALLDRFEGGIWDQWRDISGVPHFTHAAAQPDYAAVAADMAIATVPRSAWNTGARVLAGAMGRRGLAVQPLVRATAGCAEEGMDCLHCLFGCRQGRKQSAAVTTLREARALGAQLRTGVEMRVLRLDAGMPLLEGVDAAGCPLRVRARHVVLAAGAVGTTALLLRSGLGRRIPRLGRGIACHPSLVAIARMNHRIDAHLGTYTAIASHGPDLRRQGLKLEHMAAPPIGTAMLVPGFGRAHAQAMQSYRDLLFIELSIQDDAAGRLTVGWNGQPRVHKPLTAGDRQKLARGAALLREILHEAGAVDIWMSDELYGLHPMGGCAIGTDPARSVVDPDFRLHHDRRVTIADSSVFPAAPGHNPSLSIMALSHRAAQGLKATA